MSEYYFHDPVLNSWWVMYGSALDKEFGPFTTKERAQEAYANLVAYASAPKCHHA
jgi:hypothetical protein